VKYQRKGCDRAKREFSLLNVNSLETFGTTLLIHVLFPSICPALVYVSSRLTSNILGTPVTTMSYLYHVEEKFF